jgi:hypothetical protein
MTVPEDATCGVCVHELGHLGDIRISFQKSRSDLRQYLGGLIYTTLITPPLALETGA